MDSLGVWNEGVEGPAGQRGIHVEKGDLTYRLIRAGV